MRRSNRFWGSSRRPEGRPSVLLPPSAVLPGALALIVALAPGCVTRGTYDEATTERDELRAAKTTLERDLRLARASNQSLSNERAKLIDEIETLRQARAALTDSVAELEGERQRLSTDLERRQAEVEESRREVDSLRTTYDGLVGDLQREVSQGRVEIERLREGLRVQLAQEVLFPVGSARLDAEGVAILRKVVERLRDLPHEIAVHGHTDDRPIQGALAQVYPSNWELAGARAASVVRLFADAGIEAGRLEAVSFGSVRPRASNDTPEGRARNRRIELQLTPVGGTPLPAELDTAAADEDPWAKTLESDARAEPRSKRDPEPESEAETRLGPPVRGETPPENLVPPARGEAPPENLGPPVRGETPPVNLGPPVRGETPPGAPPEEPSSS